MKITLLTLRHGRYSGEHPGHREYSAQPTAPRITVQGYDAPARVSRRSSGRWKGGDDSKEGERTFQTADAFSHVEVPCLAIQPNYKTTWKFTSTSYCCSFVSSNSWKTVHRSWPRLELGSTRQSSWRGHAYNAPPKYRGGCMISWQSCQRIAQCR
ncbi:hypothetical protein RvY_02986-2 [Ramazzottius varieornatus]|uniref:Uncharacterized protein n=1 Tax=Ramazzottius varieornatus TaxID=947166 RepID=A0A1D1UTL4_RAMVA|nr:hypothetical protein RvY_02986-2 [Ramazzottius varieornatus]